jgi:hypothetical protein
MAFDSVFVQLNTISAYFEFNMGYFILPSALVTMRTRGEAAVESFTIVTIIGIPLVTSWSFFIR